MENKVLNISVAADLAELLDKKKDFSDIKLNSKSLSESERRAAEKRLSRYYFSCGCDSGGLSTALAIVIMLPLLFYLYYINLLSLWNCIFIGAAAILVASVAGKFIGLAADRKKLKQEIKILQTVLP